MLTEETIDKLVERLAERIEESNTFVLKQIGSNMKAFRNLSTKDAHRLAQVLKYGGSYQKIVNKLEEMTSLNEREIYEIFEEVAKNDYEFAKRFYDYKGIDYIPYESNSSLKAQVKAIAKLTADEYLNISRTEMLGFGWQDEKGNVIFKGIRQTYEETIDRSVIAVSQGKEDFETQMHRMIKELGGSGLKTISPKTYVSYDKDGNMVEKHYTRRLDSSLRQNMKQGLVTMHNEIQVQLGKEFGSDGVEVTVHSHPAPDHEHVQGKQFTNEEFNNFQNDRRATSYDGEIFEPELDGKDRRSIGELNCYHYVFSIILGISEPSYSKEQLEGIIEENEAGFEIDGEKYTLYEGTQMQRKLESAIRTQKDVQIMAKTCGDKKAIYESQDKISKLTSKYNELCEKSGLQRKSERLRVSGYSRVAKQTK